MLTKQVVANKDRRGVGLGGLLGLAGACCLPLVFLLAPSPFSADFLRGLSAVHLCIAGYVLLSAAIVGFFFAKRSRSSSAILSYAPAAILCYVVACYFVKDIRPTTEIAAVLLGAVVFSIGMLLGCRRQAVSLDGTGLLLGLDLFLVTFMMLEVIPSKVLLKSVDKVPYLFDPIDQGHHVYRQLGFRGQWPCTNGCPEKFLRIFTMGGSSTNGVPMVLGNRTYSAELQRLLDERRIGEHYELLNAGVAGHGITQVYVALKEELLKYKPDVVAINVWFNDTAPIPGWYGLAGVSDMEGYQRARFLRILQDLPVYKQIRGTRLYAFLSHYLTGARSQLSSSADRASLTAPSYRARMNPEEYGKVLEKIALLGEQHNFLPVFITEPLNRSRTLSEELRGNAYLAQMKNVAEKYDLPYVDILTPLSEYRREWLYYDFIHPNPQGHSIVAESIYRSLFAQATERSKQFFASHGVDVTKPLAVRESLKQFARDRLPAKEILLKARAPMRKDANAALVLSGPAGELLRFQGLGSEWSEFRVPVEILPKDLPIIDLSFRADVSVDATAPRFPIGTTGHSSAVPLVVESGGKDYGWGVAIRIHNMRYDYNHRGYNIAVIGGKTGEILDTAFFDTFVSAAESQRIAAFLDLAATKIEAGVPPIVAVAVKTDGSHLVDKELLGEAFRKLGGTGTLPEHFQSFLLVGVPGAEPGTAVEKVGPEYLRAKIGDPTQAEASLIEVEVQPGQGLL